MDDIAAAAIADGPEAEPDAFGVTTLDDRAFVYRSLSALCGVGLGLRDALDRISSTLERPTGNPVDTRRVRHYVGRASAAFAEGGGDATVAVLLDAGGFLLHDVERCILAVDIPSTDPRDVGLVAGRALEFVESMQARSSAKARR